MAAIVAGVPGDPSFEDGYRTACIGDAALQSGQESGWVAVRADQAVSTS
jgi:hypothetical protein